MPRHVKAQQLTPCQVNRQTIVGLDDPLRINRQDFPIETLRCLNPIDGNRPCHQLGRIGHMSRPAWMNDQTGVPKGGHHRTGTAGMIEMHMGRNDEINGIR